MMIILLLAAAASVQAAAFPAASITEAPTPWVSIYPDGSASTFTEHVTTDSRGSRTTVDMQPTGSSVPDNSNSQDVFAQCDSEHYELTSKGNTQPWAPFCAPKNGTNWWYTGKYYVTWNPSFWERNSTVTIMLHYIDYGGAGELAESWQVPNYLGFHPISPSKSWLINQTALDAGETKDVTSQPMAFSIIGSDDSAGNGVQEGPTVIITSDPKAKPVDTSPNNRPKVSILGLTIGLPLVTLFVLCTVGGIHCCMGTKRKVGPLSIGGGRRSLVGRGYTGRRERRRRAKMGGQAVYRDEVDGSEVEEDGQERRAWELANVKGGATEAK